MLIISGQILVEASGLTKAIAAVERVMAETQKEDGCFIYEFSQVVGAETKFRIYEEWRDGDALRAHASAPHMAEFQKAIADAGMISREIFLIKGGEKKPLG